MRGGCWGALVLVVSGTVWAQTPRKAPARPPDAPAHGTGEAAPSDAATASAPPPRTPAAKEATVTIAPPEEPGWTTVQLPGGYYRYRTDDAKPGPDDERGGLTIIPSEAPKTGAPRSVEDRESAAEASGAAPLTPPPQVIGTPPGPVPAASEACRRERGLFAQRLLELRGVSLEPEAADLLAQEEGRSGAVLPFGHVGGLPLSSGGSFLVTVVSSDTTARERLTDLARCLENARPPR
jgi:hypothetical protein